MRNALITSMAVRIAAFVAIVLTVGGVAVAVPRSANAAIVDQGCYQYKPPTSPMGTYYKCYFEGDYWSNGWHLYTRGYNIRSCTPIAGCVQPLSGSFARNWYYQNGWTPWYCETYNGYFWEPVGCTW